MSTATTWHNIEQFRKIVASGYPNTVTIEILSVEEIKTWQLDTTDGEHLRISDAWEVKSRNTVMLTGFVYEETNIVIVPEPTMQLAKNVRRITT